MVVWHCKIIYLCLYFADMQKFPLRMKDNDLLVTELYHDPSNDAITALSVYLTPKTSSYHLDRIDTENDIVKSSCCQLILNMILSNHPV